MRLIIVILFCVSIMAQTSDKLTQKCQRTEVINETDDWVKYDQQALDRAHYVCKTRYIACLKTFFKMKSLTYRAICRKPDEK